MKNWNSKKEHLKRNEYQACKQKGIIFINGKTGSFFSDLDLKTQPVRVI